MSDRLRVVVVDDTVDLRLLLRIHLERDGRFEIAGEAGDGQEGLEVAHETRPDAIVLDLAMPRMDGLTALPLLREAHPETAIVVLSGFAAGRLQERVLEAGADAYVAKGTDFDELAEHLLEGRRRRVGAAAS